MSLAEPASGPAPGSPAEGVPLADREAESTRDRLVAAAIEVFVAQGYDGARVLDVARAAGLTTGAIYANYRGKAELLFDAIGHRARAEVDALLEEAAGLDARVVLEHLGGALLHRPPAQPPLLLDAVAAARRDPELATLLRERVGRREGEIGRIVERAKRDGAIDPALDTTAFARFCLALAIGALVLRTLEVPAPAQDDWQALIRRLLDGIAPEEE